MWIAAIAIVDLMPVPMATSFDFSPSFPLELSVAILYPPPVAALIVLLGSFGRREFRGQIPLRSPRCSSVPRSPWPSSRRARCSAGSPTRTTAGSCRPTVLLAAVVGHAVNTILVAEWQAIRAARRST